MNANDEFNTSTFGSLPETADEIREMMHRSIEAWGGNDTIKGDVTLVDSSPRFDADFDGDEGISNSKPTGVPFRAILNFDHHTEIIEGFMSPSNNPKCPECGSPQGAMHIPPCGALVGREETLMSQSNPKQAYSDKKVPLHLMPPIAEILTCVGLREGVPKYGAWNFRDVPVELMTYVGAIKRHLAAIVDGEWIDPDGIEGLPKKPHIAGLLASAAILADAYYNGNLIDNRPSPGKTPELLKEFMTP